MLFVLVLIRYSFGDKLQTVRGDIGFCAIIRQSIDDINESGLLFQDPKSSKSSGKSEGYQQDDNNEAGMLGSQSTGVDSAFMSRPIGSIPSVGYVIAKGLWSATRLADVKFRLAFSFVLVLFQSNYEFYYMLFND